MVRGMPAPELTPLLILQDRDLHRIDILLQLQVIPREIEAAKVKIANEQSALESSVQALKELEVKRASLDTQLQAAEAEVVRYKNQQLSVKKQDELEALNHEIAQKQEEASQLEEAELEMLLEIDASREALEAEKAEREPTIALFRKEIENLQAKVGELEKQVADAEAAVSSARPNVEDKFLRAYDAIKQRRPKGPFVVPVEDGKCTGCHLKIAGETESALYHPDGPVTCENCGRMLYR